ncbi:MAG: hypothetical protein ABIF04_01635 [Chloroflexota bacterium]
MAEQVVLKREWVTVDLDGEELIGDSTYAREWCVDVDTHGYDYSDGAHVRAYDADGQLLDEKHVANESLVRVCVKGHQVRLFGLGTLKYALPWVLYDVKA